MKKFEKDWHGKLYAGGKAKLRVREAKLLTFSINEVGRDEFLADLKAWGYTGAFETGHNRGKFKWKTMIFLTRLFGRILGLRKIDDSKIKSSGMWGALGEGKYAANVHLKVIGEIPDNRYKDGREVV